jgi:hypothetical protein
MQLPEPIPWYKPKKPVAGKPLRQKIRKRKRIDQLNKSEEKKESTRRTMAGLARG